MADIGLNESLNIKGREFHIQTATSIEEGAIKSEIFEHGRLLFTDYYKYERRDLTREGGAELRLRRLLDQFHQSVISELETLFELSQIISRENHPISHYRLGTIFLALHLYDKAEEHLLKAIDYDTKYYSAYIALARCYYYQKRFQQAALTLEPLLKQRISYPDLYNLLGMVALEQKLFVNALNHLRQAVKLNPAYKEAYYNLAMTILQRIHFLKMQGKIRDVKKNWEFFHIVLKKILRLGNEEDRLLLAQIKQALEKRNIEKVGSLIYDYRNRVFFQKTPPENLGYEFYLWLRYIPERLDFETVQRFEEKISAALNRNPNYPDLWNYLALIHLMLCRDFFLKGLDNFKEATRINPRFSKARKNLRLVENDGREFLSLIKAIVK